MFRVKLKTFNDEIIAQALSILSDLPQYKNKEYSLLSSLSLWVIDGIRDESLHNIKLIIEFNVSEEYKFIYKLKVQICSESEVITISNKTHIVRDFNNLPLEVRKKLLLDQNVVLEKS